MAHHPPLAARVWRWRSWLVLAALVVVAPSAARAADDPVADLQQLLRQHAPLDPRTATEKEQAEIKKFYSDRDETIGKLIDTRLKTFAQLRQALMLKDWGDVVKTEREDPMLIASGLRLRSRVAQKFRAKVQQIVDQGDDDSKAAVANLLTEIALTVRAAPEPPQPGKIDDAEAQRRAGFARSLTGAVLKLAKSNVDFVRLHAVRALAGINADPRQAAPEFARQIQTSDDVKVRRVAADGFVRLVGIATYLGDQKLRTGEVWATDYDVIVAAAEVARYAPVGLEDRDARVRTRSAEALRASAQAIAKLFKKSPEDPKLLAPGAAPYTQADVQAVKEALTAFQQSGAKLVQALEDSDADVRLAAVQTLERLSDARFRLAEEPITVGTAGKLVDRVRLVPPVASDPLDTFAKGAWQRVARLLNDPNARVRLAAVHFLEFFPEARPGIVPALVQSLCDPDRFVRWGAARALGNYSKNYQPKDAVEAVPALAKMLFDPDYTDRLAAAATLESLGKYAEAAAPELARAVHYGDVENRVAALYVIQSIGPERTVALIPSLTDALGQPDPRVRRATAETLGRYGTLARNRATLDALRRALGDDDQEVRMNASEAMLQILGSD